jgi:hypothetical protein
MKTVEILEKLDPTYFLYGVPTTVDGVPYVLLTHVTGPLFSCQQLEPKLVSPGGLPAPEDPQGQCGLYPPFQRYRIG